MGWICFQSERSFQDHVTQLHELAHLLHTKSKYEGYHSNNWIKILLELGKQYNLEEQAVEEAFQYRKNP